ncbi:uncharacterized protein LOC124154353 isoform X4 [Ischnura elegans]|uniref:uncharacterized protein LOC124154353 isoform X4 n=1 Tax=Ischnura elegans TaxID=197161 RepID=UPI001ED897F7|nr:uncharacterized protein LOC124154353 isoform X4 [Ischnura elegans]
MTSSTKVLLVRGTCTLVAFLMVNQVLATVVSDDDSVEREREVHAEATYLWPCIQHEIPDEDPKAENGTTNRISQFCGRQDIIVDCLRERSDNLTRTFDNATDTGVFMRDMLTRLVSFACDNDAEMLRGYMRGSSRLQRLYVLELSH